MGKNPEWGMEKKRVAAVLAVAAFALFGLDRAPAHGAAAVGADRPGFAKDTGNDPAPERRPIRTVRPRIEVRPERLLYRECVDTTREVWRPYWGYVVMPSMRCWWVRK
jgi:hypothetical protein